MSTAERSLKIPQNIAHKLKFFAAAGKGGNDRVGHCKEKSPRRFLREQQACRNGYIWRKN